MSAKAQKATNKTKASTKVVEEEIVEEVDTTNTPTKKAVTRDTLSEQFDNLVNECEDFMASYKDVKVLKTTAVTKQIKSLMKGVKSLQKSSLKLVKTKKPKTQTNENSGFQKPVKISKELAKFAGWKDSELHSRTDVTKFICSYIKDNNLQNADDKRLINFDSKLDKLFGHSKSDDNKQFRYCDIQTFLKKENHFPK